MKMKENNSRDKSNEAEIKKFLFWNSRYDFNDEEASMIVKFVGHVNFGDG